MPEKDIESQSPVAKDELDQYIDQHPNEFIIVCTLFSCSITLFILGGFLLLCQGTVWLIGAKPLMMRWVWTLLLGGLATLTVIVLMPFFPVWYRKHRKELLMWLSGALSVGLSLQICYGVYTYVL